MCYEPFMLRYAFNEITIPSKSCLKRPLIIVQLSDLHLQWPYPYVTEKSLKSIVHTINTQIHPDFVFLTGDYISRYRSHSISSSNTAALIRGLRGLEAKYGVYCILGNNDFRALPLILDMFKELNYTLLRNQTTMVNIDDTEKIRISGLDPSKSLEIARERLNELNLDTNNYSNTLKILLAHEPDVAVVSSNYGFDIQFSGHSHGGQCVAPFGIGPLIVPTMGWRFPLGLYQIKRMLLFVSSGIGISPLPKPPVRFNNRPEVAVLKLITNDESKKQVY